VHQIFQFSAQYLCLKLKKAHRHAVSSNLSDNAKWGATTFSLSPGIYVSTSVTTNSCQPLERHGKAHN
jgi:hypothetical protein